MADSDTEKVKATVGMVLSERLPDGLPDDVVLDQVVAEIAALVASGACLEAEQRGFSNGWYAARVSEGIAAASHSPKFPAATPSDPSTKENDHA